MLALAGLVAVVRRRTLPTPALAGTVLAAGVYTGGLLLSIAIERYTWAPILLLVPAAAVGLDVLVGHHRRWWAGLAAALTLVMAASAAHGLLPRWDALREVTTAAAELEDATLEGSGVVTAGSWQETHLLCHHLGCRYFGRPEADDAATAAAQLEAVGVDRFVVWADDADAIAGLPPPGPDELLRVFEVGGGQLRLLHRVAR